MKKGPVVEPSTTPMNGSMVWPKNVSLKYHRVWQAQVDLSFLLTEGTRQKGEPSQGGMCARREGHAEDQGKEEGAKGSLVEKWQRTESEQKVVSLMLRKHLINLAEVVIEKGSLRIWHKFPSDIMAWHGGGQSAKSECL
jgi:hypothetical protein